MKEYVVTISYSVDAQDMSIANKTAVNLLQSLPGAARDVKTNVEPALHNRGAA